MLRSSLRRFWSGSAALVVVSGCVLREEADPDAVAASCGGACPAGTWRDEVRKSRSSSIAYVDFVEGSCSWSCVAVADCPPETVPVITEDCFTCARAMPSGSLAGGSCDPEDWFLNRTDEPDGQVGTVEIGGSADLEESIRFEGLTFLEAWDVDYQPRALAAWGNVLYVADHAPGLLHRLDAETGDELGTIDLGSINALDLVASGSTVWVADGGLYAFDLSSGSLVASRGERDWEGGIAYDGAFLLEVDGTRFIRRDPENLDLYDEVSLESPLEGPAEWAPGRLIGAEVRNTDPLTWRFPIYDLRDYEPHPVASTMSIELDAGPAHGMAILGDRMFVTGAFEGSLQEKILVLAVE